MTETLTQTFEAEKPPLYEPITVPFGEADVNVAMQLYLEFLQLPDDIKHKFHYLDKLNPRTSEAGYMRRRQDASDKPTGDDNKHVFHYTPELWQAQRQIPWHEKPEVARQFIEASDQLYYQLARAVKDKMAERADEAPWLVGVHFPADGTLKHHLRFLAYQQGKDGVLARGHYDKSTSTVAVAQSCGGLRIGEGEEDLTPVQRANFEPIIFDGYGWHQLNEMLGQTTNRRAAWHDAVESECDSTVDEEIMRWALIYFVNPAKIYLESTYEQTHTPIRWRNVGRLAIPLDAKQSFLISEAA